jgi:hypothetical protein
MPTITTALLLAESELPSSDEDEVNVVGTMKRVPEAEITGTPKPEEIVD